MDTLFLEFYIKKKYSQKLEDYFNISKQSVSLWRKSNYIPANRQLEILQKEGSLDIKELFNKLY